MVERSSIGVHDGATLASGHLLGSVVAALDRSHKAGPFGYDATGDWGPHRTVQQASATPWNQHCPDHSTQFRDSLLSPGDFDFNTLQRDPASTLMLNPPLEDPGFKPR